MAFNEESASPAELVAEIRRIFQASWVELGGMLDRSEKMVRKIAKGETSGESYREAFLEILRQGRVVHRPPRRRRKDGSLVKVRAKNDAKDPLVTPVEHAIEPKEAEGAGEISAADKQKAAKEDTEGRTARKRPRRRFRRETTVFPDGGRQHKIEMPKGKKTKGHAQGMGAILDTFRRVAKGQKAGDKRVKVSVVFDMGNGETRRVEIGSHAGYHSSDILADVRKLHGGDVEGWINDQVRERYTDFDPVDFSIIQAEIQVFDAARSKAERKALDEQDARRWNRDRHGRRLIEPAPMANRKSRARKRNRDNS